MDDAFDVVIAGASFAGLAVACQLRGHRVLLVDRNEIGAGEVSACGTILRTLEYWGLAETVLQRYRHLIIHTPHGTIPFASPYEWCTFDYSSACRILYRRSGAAFLKAPVTGVQDGTVLTRHGPFRPRCIVEATGWRAALASSLAPGYVRQELMNSAVETRLPLKPGDPAGALHFWYMPGKAKRAIGWVFPRGEVAGIGVGSYRSRGNLKRRLVRFARRLDHVPDRIHGNCFPSALRAPTAGPLFVVGDAAGMCLGLTGEGIRPALFFGEACGHVVRRVADGELSLEEGLAEYDSFVRSYRIYFRCLTAVQSIFTSLPAWWFHRFARMLSHDRVRPWAFDTYWRLTRRWGETTHPADEAN